MEVRVVSGDEIRRTADRLRQVDKKLPGQLRKELRKAALPAVKRVKAEVRSMPAAGVRGGTSRHPHKARQLRRTIARGVRIQASTGGKRGAGLRIATVMPTSKQAMLPRGLDAGEKGFRHPVFGNRDMWVTQPGGSWFREPLAHEFPDVRGRIQRLLEETDKWIADAGARRQR